MKINKINTLPLFLGVGLSLSFCAAQAQALKTNADSVSYALGQDVGASLFKTGMTINDKSFLQGMHDAFADGKQLFTEGQRMEILQAAFSKAQDLKVEKQKKEEEEFFAKLKNQKGIVQGPEGIYYEVLVEGKGAKPTTADDITVHYKGTLLSGTVFDNSYDRSEPLELTLESVVRGWQLGIPLMGVGSKYKFYIPSALGYGPRGAGKIPAYSTLIFEIELLGIKGTNAL